MRSSPITPVEEGDSPREGPSAAGPRVLAAVALLAAQLLAGCRAASDPPICRGAGLCGAGYCVVGRCRPEEATPAPADARRVVLSPEDVAVLASTPSLGERARMPEDIVLGRAAGGSLVVLLRFTSTWRDDAEIASAFLVLDPVPGAPPAGRDVTLEVARILEPWRSETATWGRQPRLSLPETAAVARRSPAVPLRIEVTAMVRGWAERRPDDHGIAILAPGEDPVGATYSMGISDGAGPRLEVYLR